MPIRRRVFHGNQASENVSLQPHIYGADNETKYGFEPQFVQIRSNNKGIIWLDYKDRDQPNRTNLGNFRISQQLMVSNLKRIALEHFSIQWNMGQVNDGNNTITFYSTASAANHTVTVVNGFYDPINLTGFATAIQTALNTATGASGLTWTVTPRVNNVPIIDFSTAGGSFHFNGGLMYQFGRSLINLPRETANTTTKTAGWVNMMWTRYVIVKSEGLMRTKRIQNASSGFDSSSWVEFIWPTREEQSRPNTHTVTVVHRSYINMHGNIVANLDFTLEDEFGRDVGFLFQSPIRSDVNDDNGDYITVWSAEL